MVDTEELFEQYRTEQDYFKKCDILHTLKGTKKITTKELARRLAMKPSYVCHILRLARLPEMVIDGYYSKLVSISHLFIIARLKTPEQMIEAYEKVLARNLTSAKTDALIREMLYNIKENGLHIPNELVHELRQKVAGDKPNIDIKVIQTRVRAKIIIETWGNLAETSNTIRSFVGRIKGVQQ